MAMNEMDMGEMMPDESMQSMQIEGVDNMESEPKQNPIDIIKQDHRKVEGLFEQFESTEDKKQKLEIAKQICMELTVHAQYEEELVYPLLMQEDEDTGEEAELEHELIKFMISQIEGSTASDKTLGPKVKVLKELVEHHVEEEEDEALPELEDNEELKGRGGQIMERKQELMQQMMKGGKSRGGRKTAAKSSGGRGKAASSSRGGSKTKKAAAGRKGGSTSRGKSTSSSRGKSSSSSKTSSSRGKSGSSSSRGKSSSSSKTSSSRNKSSSSSKKPTGSKSTTKRGAAGSKTAASRGGKSKSSSGRAGKKGGRGK